MRHFLENGPATPAVRHDTRLEQTHWATNRSKAWPTLRDFAFDHRSQLVDIATGSGSTAARIGAFKCLCLDTALRVADGRDGYGVLCDDRLGCDAFYAAAGTGLWIGRPVERPRRQPLEVEIGDDFGSSLAEWPAEHVAKVLCLYRPDDPDELRARQEAMVKRLAGAAARANGLDFLLEVVPSKFGPMDEVMTAAIVDRFYAIGVYPDWWKLEPMVSEKAWRLACDAIASNDPHCRGILVLGLDAPARDLHTSFGVAARHDLVKGFAVGRTIFTDVARAWMAGTVTDDAAVTRLAETFAGLCTARDEASAGRRGP